jgi:endonuclease-8
MSGSWHIYRAGERWKSPGRDMRIAIETGEFTAVCFRVQVAEFHTADTLRRHPGVRRLGPDVLAPEFDEATALARLRARASLETGVAMLSQSIVAGIGNVFKSEVCFASGVNPFRKVATLTEEEMHALMRNARDFLARNTEHGGPRRTTGRSNPIENLWVYKRSGEPCRKCGTVIESRKQGLDARITFWCPQCQPQRS